MRLFFSSPPHWIYSELSPKWLGCVVALDADEQYWNSEKQSARDVWHILLNIVTAADVFATSLGSRQSTSRLPLPWLTAVATAPPDSAKFNNTHEAVDQENSSEGVGRGPFHNDLCKTTTAILKLIWSVFQNKAKQTRCKNRHIRLFYGGQCRSRDVSFSTS